MKQNNGDYIVLLHGLGRTSRSMKKLEKVLNKDGYQPININYPTRNDKIEDIVEKYLKTELKEKCLDRNRKINFITHSMGGILVRYFLASNKLDNLGKVIMLAPPNKGSETANKWANRKIGKYILGPAISQLTSFKNSFVNNLPKPSYELGIIAGKYDGKVSIEKTQLEGAKDFLIVPRFHTFIMNANEVTAAIELFLKKGSFK